MNQRTDVSTEGRTSASFRFALSFAAVCAIGAAEAFTLASPERCARIVLGANESECVRLAAEDLRGDVKKITGLDLEVVAGPARAGDVEISTRPEGGAWESYDVAEEGGVLRFRGADVRGTMFAVYEFIETYLGVDPLYFWSDREPAKKAALAWEKVAIHRGSPSFRFRGWFNNDEDLLTKWHERSGTRDYSTYHYYHDVMALDIAERIAEALVRSRYNMLIPGSFMNIDEPAEAAILAAAAKRGMFLTMHHIEPLGTSGFAFKDYWKKRGRTVSYSYFSNPKEVEEVWRHQAAKWAKLPNVIWQIGLRGAEDRPMWNEDPNIPKDDAGRARVISKAMHRQLEILDEVGVPRAGRFFSTTLWAEGASFYERKLLDVPAGTIVVFADNNCGWKWQSDLLNGRRDLERYSYGVYYHHNLIGCGPHLASLVPAAKTCAMLREATAHGAGSYAIFNVSNVREFIYGIAATRDMTWDLAGFDAEKWTRTWLQARHSTDLDAWVTAYNTYHKSLQLHPKTGMPLFLDGLMSGEIGRTLNRMGRILNGKEGEKGAFAPAPEPTETSYAKTILGDGDTGAHAKGATSSHAKDAFWVSLSEAYPNLDANPRDKIARLAAQKAWYGRAVALGRRLLVRAPEAERNFAYDSFVYPAELMLGYTTADLAVNVALDDLLQADREAAARELDVAAEALKRILECSKEYCRGEKWANWYRGCEKLPIGARLDRVLDIRARLEGLGRN